MGFRRLTRAPLSVRLISLKHALFFTALRRHDYGFDV